MNKRNQFVERDIETVIDKKLRELGWIEDIYSKQRNIYKQQPATEEQKKKLKGKRADYILYQSGTTNPLIVIEAKRPSEDIYQALEQGINYAKSIEVPLVIATNGEFTKAYHINFKKTLTLNGEEVKDFFSEKDALRFIEQPHLITQENKVVLSRRELIKIFAEANNLLRKKGLQAGEERFSEFANILFLKIISEIEESKEQSTVEKEHLWNSWSQEKGNNLKSRINSALEHFRKKYKEGELFSVSKIEDAKTLEEMVTKFNPLSLVETERDVKGEAFEYFLQRYNAGEKDLGEYFTPRHAIRNLVNILQPRFKDKIYDPFCGTGGMLTECFRYVSERTKIDSENLKTLRNSFYGNEITNVARITKMNMILFGDGHNNIQKRDTFQFPVNEEYDLVITNIPFGFDDIDYGHLYRINCKYGDCLAIQHCLEACKENGRIALIMPEGFFTQRIKKYQATKKWIIENYSIQAIISLPKGIFLPYTGAKSSVIIIEKKKRTKDYFYYYQIKNDGFTLNNHRDRIEGINDWDILVSTWKEVVREEKANSPLFTKVYYKDVEENGYNLLFRPYNFPLPEYKEKNYLLLSEIADIFRGLSLEKTDFISGPSSWKFWQQKNVISNDFSWSSNFIADEKFKTIKNKLEIDDILITLDGTVGETVLCSEIMKEGIPSSHIAVIRVKQDYKNTKILPRFLLWVFKSPQMKEKLISQSSGTIFLGLSLDNLKKNLIPIPSLEEQKKLVGALNKIEENIKSGQKIIDSLNLSLFLPSLYENKKISDICLINPSKSEIKDKKDIETSSFLPMEDCEKHSLYVYPQKVKKIEEVHKGYTYFQENDLLLAKITPCFENGKMSIAKNLVNGIGFGSTEFIVLRAKEGILIEWVYYYLRNSNFLEEGKKIMTGSVGHQRISIDFINNYPILIPPLEIQKELIDELKEIEKDKENLISFICHQKKILERYLNNLYQVI
ncbi:MAG: hypothetical protein mread185_000266 [Mycoplasmataceae bacterium]|nr:MAG: hypothetical protein mread185_000266 [Mycoplasmataceae bacterium]